MSKYRKTFNCLFGPINDLSKLQAQCESIELLKKEDTCWITSRVWITYEPVFAGGYDRVITIVTKHDLEMWTRHVRGTL